MADSATFQAIDPVLIDSGIEQHAAYVAWVNSQLKKKPHAHLIEDLRNDMKDGVNFINIVEIVSGEQIPGSHLVPSSYSEMQENIDLVLQFMAQQRIKMHRINSRDIVEGNLKAIMRLILALAAHYKPMSVRHSSCQRSFSKMQSVVGIAQGASAALAEAKRVAKRAGKRRSRHSRRNNESSSEPCSDSDQSCLRPDSRLHPSPQERRELEGASASSSPVSSCIPSPRTSLYFSDDIPCNATKDSGAVDMECVSCDSGLLEDSQAEALREVRQQLLQLQDLILTNSPEGAANLHESYEAPTPEQSLVLKSQLQHMTLVAEELREELSSLKNECLQLQGTKAGLQSRLMDQDVLLSQIKSEKLHLEIELQTVLAENETLHKQLRDQVAALKAEHSRQTDRQEQTITNLKRDLIKRDQQIDKLQQDLKEQKVVIQELQELRTRLQAVGQTGASLSAKVAYQDRRMAELQGQLRHTETGHYAANESTAEIEESIHKIQQVMSSAGPHVPPLDALERSIITMLQNLRASRHSSANSFSQSLTHKASLYGTDHQEVNRVVPQLRPEVKRLVGRGNAFGQAGDGPSATTVIFFTDHSIQPTACLIPGRLGEIKLCDFKKLFEKAEQFRYYFKALDPEYGTVKEELVRDDAVVPGWEGKIVAWVESETGTPC